MRTHLAIIADAGGFRALAGKLGLPAARVRFWKRRESIPAEMWRAVAHAQIASLEELATAAEARAVSEVHTPTKRGRGKKPADVQVEVCARSAKPARASKRASAKAQASA